MGEEKSKSILIVLFGVCREGKIKYSLLVCYVWICMCVCLCVCVCKGGKVGSRMELEYFGWGKICYLIFNSSREIRKICIWLRVLLILLLKSTKI